MQVAENPVLERIGSTMRDLMDDNFWAPLDELVTNVGRGIVQEPNALCHLMICLQNPQVRVFEGSGELYFVH